VDAAKDSLELVFRHMQKTGAGPDAVIGLLLVELMKQHGLDRTAKAAKSDHGHFGRTVGRTHGKARLQHFGRMVAGAAAEFEDRAARRQQGEEAGQPGGWCFRPPGIGLRIAPIES
jgi:hypothetical protein